MWSQRTSWDTCPRGTFVSGGNTNQNQGKGEQFYQEVCVERPEIEVRSRKKIQFAYQRFPRLLQSCTVQSPVGFVFQFNTSMLFAANTRKAGEGAKWVWGRGAGKHPGKSNVPLERTALTNKCCLGGCREEFPVLAHWYTSTGHLLKGEGKAHPALLCCVWGYNYQMAANAFPSSQGVPAPCHFISRGSKSIWKHISHLDLSHISFSWVNMEGSKSSP